MTRQKWIVEFEVDDLWVADGFEITDESALEMLSDRLGYAYEWERSELGAKVVSAPAPDTIRRLQSPLSS